MSLNFRFELKENPYTDVQSKYLIWSRIILLIDNKVIIDHQWDLLEIVEWFFATKPYLLQELPFKKNGNSSIAEIREYIYESVDDKTDLSYIEKLEDYFSNHSFRLKGTSLGLYYIGVFNDTLGQISYHRYNSIHFYDFDMNQFIRDTKNEIYSTLKKWEASPYQSAEAMQRIKNIQGEYSDFLVS